MASNKTSQNRLRIKREAEKKPLVGKEAYEDEIKKITRKRLKSLNQELLSITYTARGKTRERGRDITKKVREKIKKIVEKQERHYIQMLNSARAESFEEIVKKHKFKTREIEIFFKKAFKRIREGKKEVTEKELTYLLSIAENIDNLYDKEGTKIVDLIIKIDEGKLDEKDWDLICAKIHSQGYQEKVLTNRDQVELSVSAFFIRIMRPDRREQAVLEYAKRYGKKDAISLAKALGGAKVLGLAQIRKLIGKIDPGTTLSEEEEKNLLKQQKITEVLGDEIRRKVLSRKAYNMAEMINFKTIPPLLALIVFGLSSFANALAYSKPSRNDRFNPLRFLTKKHGLFAALGATASAEWLARATGGPGFLRRLYEKKPGAPEIMFGDTKSGRLLEKRFNEMADILRNYPLMNDLYLKWGMFKDSNAFYIEDDKARISKDRSWLKKSVYERMLYVQNTITKNKKGANILRLAKARYGQRKVEELIVKMTIAAQLHGITNRGVLNSKRTPDNRYTYRQYLRRKGVPV